MRYKLNLYSPQFVARQFGFAQALSFPVYFNPAEPLVKYEKSNTAEFDDAISLTEERVKGYHRVPGLTRCCYSTQSFNDWWSSYFISHCPSLEQALTNLNLASIVQSAPVSKKTKGTHINEILSFEKFYKVKWNVMWLRPTFYSTLDIWKRKKAAHEDRCFKNYLKAKQIDPLTCPERFVKPFRYPPFPNAQFGISYRLPDPIKVAKPIAIRGTASEPTKPVEDWVSDAEHSPKKKKEKKGSARAKSSSTTTLTSRKRNADERAFDAEGPVAKMARTSQPQKK
ncbi:hypothetical protein PIB30_073869, partial [Stylosanthes scabra]|nr:hypothetical protein [Stylosanthes scabra]